MTTWDILQVQCQWIGSRPAMMRKALFCKDLRSMKKIGSKRESHHAQSKKRRFPRDFVSV
jgi:hypothetical protein